MWRWLSGLKICLRHVGRGGRSFRRKSLYLYPCLDARLGLADCCLLAILLRRVHIPLIQRGFRSYLKCESDVLNVFGIMGLLRRCVS